MRIKRLLYWSSLAVCTIGLAVCGVQLARQWMTYRAGASAYDTLQQQAVSVPAQPAAQAEPDAQPESDAQESPAETAPDVDFAALQAINPEVVGWLYCADTVLSYPVVQGEDNTYYLDHLFDGTQNSAGCLFIDSRWNEEQDQNCVIYGHHMKNGTMFASLEQYRQQSYYDAHPTLLWVRPEGVWTIELFAGYFTESEGDAWQMHFQTGQEYTDWLQRVQARSCFTGSVTPTPADRVVTLSTCSYVSEDARFVCHGVLRTNPA